MADTTNGPVASSGSAQAPKLDAIQNWINTVRQHGPSRYRPETYAWDSKDWLTLRVDTIKTNAAVQVNNSAFWADRRVPDGEVFILFGFRASIRGALFKPASGLASGISLIGQGVITAAADFPLLAAVTPGWVYTVTVGCTDSVAGKTGTGQTFVAGNVIVWNGVNWTVVNTFGGTSPFYLPPNPAELADFKLNFRQGGTNRDIFSDNIPLMVMVGGGADDEGLPLDFNGKAHFVTEPGGVFSMQVRDQPNKLTNFANGVSTIGGLRIQIIAYGVCVVP